MIATYVLASVVIILCFALGLALFKYTKILKKEKDSMRKSSENIPSAKSISSSVEVMQNLWLSDPLSLFISYLIKKYLIILFILLVGSLIKFK